MPVVVTIVAKDTKSPLDKPCAVAPTVSPVSVKLQAKAVVNGLPVPVTCISAVMPVVEAMVIVVEFAVDVPLKLTGVGAPQLLEMVSVCAPLALPRFVQMFSIAAWLSLQNV